MLRRTKTQALKENAASAADFATALAKDKKFRKQLLSAMGHGAVAQKRAARKIALIATAGRLTRDPKLKREVRKMTQSLEKAWSRVERKRSHKLRNSLFIVAGVGVGGAAVAAVKSRKGALSSVPFTGGTSPRAIDEITRAPSSGVNCSFSTAPRTCFTSVSATFHFGSIADPNSVGFIDANCRTSDGEKFSAIAQPPWVEERTTRHAREPSRLARRSIPQIPNFERTRYSRSLRTI